MSYPLIGGASSTVCGIHSRCTHVSPWSLMTGRHADVGCSVNKTSLNILTSNFSFCKSLKYTRYTSWSALDTYNIIINYFTVYLLRDISFNNIECLILFRYILIFSPAMTRSVAMLAWLPTSLVAVQEYSPLSSTVTWCNYNKVEKANQSSHVFTLYTPGIYRG